MAAEVRSLAGRSASASKEIKTLINESASQVKSGAELVNQAGTTLKDIVGSVQKVAGIVSEIATASGEQATGIDEINTAITQMDETTQQNAALVEENTAAAQSMVEQAQQLERLMQFFTINEVEDNAAEHMRQHSRGPEIVKPAARMKTAGKAKSSVRASVKGGNISRAQVSMVNKVANGHTHSEGWEEF